MKGKEFKNNNSNKLIIGVSIMFCIVILIIGTAFAYFTQSTSKDIDDIVSNDQLLLEYKDDLNNYMRGDLIPSTKENAITAYNREGDNKCIDDYGYSACSIYRFSIKNISNVSQSLIMTLNPTANSFSNLKFMLYEVTEQGNNLIQDTTDLIKENYEPIPLYKSYDLDDNKTKIFELVFYIEAKDEDQTGVDSGKQFGAGVRINSITTGKYIAKNFGPNCWNLDETNPEKLVKFNGINHDTGEIDEMCTGYVSQDEYGYYSVNVPSSVGGQDVTIIGNNLFNAVGGVEEDGPILNKYGYIKEINIEEGIKEIEDGDMDSMKCSFIAIGFGIEDENYGLNVNLPNTLIKTGSFAFYATQLKNINLPNGVKRIADYSFFGNRLTSVIIPKNVETIGRGAFFGAEGEGTLSSIIFEGAEDGTSKLKIIGNEAFLNHKITSVTIPASVEIIEEDAFYTDEDIQLENVVFVDTKENPSQLKYLSGFANNSITSVTIPSNVEKIGESAFSYCDLTTITIPASVKEIESEAFLSNKNLVKVIFEGALTGDSKLHTLGSEVFSSCNLTYETDSNPLILPSGISGVGDYLFGGSGSSSGGNFNLKYIFFVGDTSGFGYKWNSYATVITKFPNNDNHLNVVG